MQKQQKTTGLISLTLTVLSVVFLLAAVVHAADADMTGKWTMQVTSDSGTGSPVFTLKQEGQTLSGTYSGQFGEAPVTGTVTGNDFKITYEMSGTVVTYSGKVQGKACEGNADFGAFGKATFTGKK